MHRRIQCWVVVGGAIWNGYECIAVVVSTQQIYRNIYAEEVRVRLQSYQISYLASAVGSNV